MAEKTVQASEQSILEAKNHLRDVRARYREGMALENDVLRARLRISQAEMDLVSRKADLGKARSAFRRVVDLNPEEAVSVEWSEDDFHGTMLPEIDKALAMRPEFKVFDAALSVSEKTAQQAHSDLLPSIGLFGAFNYGRPGLDLPANEWMHYFSGGLSLNWNIWDWGISSRNVEKAVISQKKTRHNRKDFTRQLTKQLADAVLEYNEAKKKDNTCSGGRRIRTASA